MPPRRTEARIPVERLCSVLACERAEPALVVDLAEAGLRLQRPPAGIIPGRRLQIEFEVPGYDELIWACGEVCFDQLWAVAAGAAAPPRLVRTSGIRLIAGARRQLRMLRDYVVESRRTLARAGALPDRRGPDRPQSAGDWLLRASGFVRG